MPVPSAQHQLRVPIPPKRTRRVVTAPLATHYSAGLRDAEGFPSRPKTRTLKGDLSRSPTRIRARRHQRLV